MTSNQTFGENIQLDDEDELLAAWIAYRGGLPVLCGDDGMAVALSVDASAGLYRFVCTHCGSPSPWFESTKAGLRIRSVTATFDTRPLRDE